MMHVGLIEHRSAKGRTWLVTVEGEYLRTSFASVRAFRSEAGARKEVTRLLGNDVAFHVVSWSGKPATSTF